MAENKFNQDEEAIDIIELAEEERLKGNLKKSRDILTFCLETCTGNGDLVVLELKARVKLAHVLAEQEEFAKASKEFGTAYGMYSDPMTDDDRALHPVAYLPLWAECCEKLCLTKKAARLRAKAEELTVEYESYWEEPDVSSGEEEESDNESEDSGEVTESNDP